MQSISFPGATTLDGRFVRLEPLCEGHVSALARVSLDPTLWRYMPRDIDSEEKLGEWVNSALAGFASGTAVPFATVHKGVEGDTVVGSTRFLSLALEHRRGEIGGTFVAPPWQRTAVNTEAKYLMLRFAFEEWGLHRVELKTHSKNVRSREAILRLGATQEGVFRKHMILDDGEIRDSVYFSIVDDDWPATKRRLEERLYGGR